MNAASCNGDERIDIDGCPVEVDRQPGALAGSTTSSARRHLGRRRWRRPGGEGANIAGSGAFARPSMRTTYSAAASRTRGADTPRNTGSDVALDMVNQMISEVHGVVVEGDHRGHALGYPTANLASQTAGSLPDDGVYAGHVIRADGTSYLAAISIGSRPTYYGDGAPVVAEAHLLDFDDDLYGEELTVLIEESLRGQLRFESEDELKARMADDVESVRSWAISLRSS